MKKIIFLIILLVPIKIYSMEQAVVDINELNIYQIQEYVDKGYLNYEKLIKLYLERIEQYNKQYNALITINENAIEEAKKLDLEYQKSGRRSLIHGLPVIVKDNIDVEGLPTTNGTKGLLDSYPYKNSSVVQKLIDNGAIIIAKANMDEFAFNATYTYSSFGYTYNAYNTNYSSYGSSGGSAVAVASNLAVFALGTDTGSSIRVPSSANGVVGIRPTFDLINTDGVIKFEETRDVVGIITKYVSDSAIILDLIDNAEINYVNYLNKSLKGIKIAVIKGFMNPNTNSNSIDYGKTDKFIYDMMNTAIADLENLGAEIIYLDNFYLTYKFDATTMCYNFNEYIKGTSSKIKSLNDLINNGGYTQNIEYYNNFYCNNDYKKTDAYQTYLNIRNNNIKKANNKFIENDIDAIIYPTLKTELYTIEEAKYKQIYTPSSSTAPLIGFPAISVPMGFYNNLPYGLEIMTQANNEKIIYQIASAYENLNNYYQTPSIAPSLYEIPSEINNLLEYYDLFKNNKQYETINNEVKNYLINFDGNVDNINYLINKYDEKNLIDEPTIKNDDCNYIIILLGILIVIIIIKKVKK